ncbi:LCP family protein [Lactococcus fujiensis]|uniref:LCP family glycopolymer transferase n=1 Tax=Lactococcus fujiensis TaxID=610251 RepID=UPI000BDFA88C|nr:LCP family protein [Lactococcus fujiensis]
MNQTAHHHHHRGLFHTHHHKSKHHNHFVLKVTLGIVGFLLLTLAGVAYGIYKNVQNTYQNSYIAPSTTTSSVSISNLHAMSILIVETGSGSTQSGPCYAMGLAVMNKNTKQMGLVNLPIDAKISGQKTLLQNFQTGGENQAQMSVQSLLGLQITKFVQVDVTKIGDLVAAVGGIEIDNPTTFTSAPYQFGKGNLSLVSAAQVAAYIGTTDGGQNNAISERVLKVSTAVYQKIKANTSIKSLADLSYYQNILNTFSNAVHTDIDFSEFQTIALQYNTALKNAQKINLVTQKKMEIYQ